MGQAKTTYVASSDLALTVVGLASDTNLLIGRQSSEWDNTISGYRDAWVSFKFTTGTTPTTGRSIELWAVGYNGLAYPESFSTLDAGRTITSQGKQGFARLVFQGSNTAVSDTAYEFGPRLLSDVFSGDVPQKVAFFLVHSTGVVPNATATNHFLRIQPVYDLF
jgi:hypothetical protein